MAAYFHHPHAAGPGEIPSSGGLHTLILMNQNLAATAPPNTGYSDSHAPPHNILLLNSPATLSHAPPPLHHPQFIRHQQQQQDHQNNNITLYGYPQQEAREVTRRLHLSLNSSDNAPSYDGLVSPEAGASGGQSSVLGSRFLKAAQELLEEVVHVGDHLTPKSSDSPRKAAAGESSPEGDKRADGARAQLSTSERQEIQMKKAKLVSMLEEAEQRYRQYHHQMQIVIASFEQVAGVGSAKTYTELALKTISKQFRCLKDAIQGQIRAANKSLGEEEGGGGGSGSGGIKIEGSRLKYIDHQIRQQRALQQMGMIQNHNAWRPQRGLPERSVSVLRAWLFEHFLHPYPKDSDKIMLAKQTGLTRSQVSNWFINARVRLWKPMIEEMYAEEMKEHQQQNAREEKNNNNNNNEEDEEEEEEEEENGNNNQDYQPASNNSPTYHQNLENQIITNKSTTKDRNRPSSSCSPPPLMSSIPISSTTPPPSSFQHGFSLLEMEGISQGSPKRQRNDEILIKFGGEHKDQGRENVYPIISGGMNFVGGEWFGTEEFPPQSRFLPSNGNGNGNGNGISLSLGLPPCENNSHHHHQHMDLGAPNHGFLSPNQSIQFRRANDFSSITNPPSHSSAAAFECIDIQNRKNFAAQLLPDFVA